LSRDLVDDNVVRFPPIVHEALPALGIYDEDCGNVTSEFHEGLQPVIENPEGLGPDVTFEAIDIIDLVTTEVIEERIEQRIH
jgi:hypothetical protein